VKRRIGRKFCDPQLQCELNQLTYNVIDRDDFRRVELQFGENLKQESTGEIFSDNSRSDEESR